MTKVLMFAFITQFDSHITWNEMYRALIFERWCSQHLRSPAKKRTTEHCACGGRLYGAIMRLMTFLYVPASFYCITPLTALWLIIGNTDLWKDQSYLKLTCH